MNKKKKKKEELKNAFQKVTESVCDPDTEEIVKDQDVQQANNEINIDENLADRG